MPEHGSIMEDEPPTKEEIMRKRLASDFLERENIKKQRVRERNRISSKKSYNARKARVDADPVEKERYRRVRATRERERRARIKTDPEAREKFREKNREAIKRHRAKKRVI
jgi:hypothetical protein